MSQSKTTATYVLSASLVSLALGLVYFSYTLSRTLIALPELIEEFQVVQERMAPLVEEVHEIQVQIPAILEEVAQVREQIPPILVEVEAILNAIPPILEETEQIREAIPPVIKEAASYREQIPVVMAQVEGIQLQIPLILEEVEQVRATIPEIIAQVEAIRAELPELLDKADEISVNIGEAGKKAGEGAVSGIFTGIVKAPMNMVSGLGDRVLKSSPLGEEDRILVIQAAEKLMVSGKEGDVVQWRNEKSGFQGSVTLVSDYKKSWRRYMDIKIVAYKDPSKPSEATVTFKQNKDGTWELEEEP